MSSRAPLCLTCLKISGGSRRLDPRVRAGAGAGYGYCKFKDRCKRTHYEEKCGGSDQGKGAKHCHKRHPLVCKRYNTDKGCKLGRDRAYQHT